MNRFFPLIGALLFGGLFAGLSAISNHYCGDLTVGDVLGIEPPVIAASISAETVPSITGPDEIPAGKPAWFAVAGVSGTASAAFLPTALLDTDPSRVIAGNALFWVAEPGTYVLTAIVVDWDAKRFTPLSKQVTVTGVPQPNPQPTPEPDPPPVPGERFVLILSESADRTPAEAAVLEALRRHLQAMPEPPIFRILDPDTPTVGNWGTPYKAEIERRKLALPVLAVSVLPSPSNRLEDPYFVCVEALPLGAAEAIALVQEAMK